MKIMAHFPKTTKRNRTLILAIVALFIIATFAKGLYHWLIKPAAAPTQPVIVQTVRVKEASIPKRH
jgi:hypothetical protein